MKAFTIILFIFFFGVCNAQFISDDDKLHFGAGAIISATTYTVVYMSTKNKKKAFWMSLGASALAGLAKEVYDSGKKKNMFDTGELVATTFGGLTASTTLSLFVGKKRDTLALVN